MNSIIDIITKSGDIVGTVVVPKEHAKRFIMAIRFMGSLTIDGIQLPFQTIFYAQERKEGHPSFHAPLKADIADWQKRMDLNNEELKDTTYLQKLDELSEEARTLLLRASESLI